MHFFFVGRPSRRSEFPQNVFDRCISWPEENSPVFIKLELNFGARIFKQFPGRLISLLFESFMWEGLCAPRGYLIFFKWRKKLKLRCLDGSDGSFADQGLISRSSGSYGTKESSKELSLSVVGLPPAICEKFLQEATYQ